jgi:hypothetical protein
MVTGDLVIMGLITALSEETTTIHHQLFQKQDFQ